MKFCVLDCETCNSPTVNGVLEFHSAQAYDLGGKVIDEQGNVYEQFNWVIEDVFFGMPSQMKDAYYAEKIPSYLQEMRTGERQIINIWQAYYNIREICKRNNVTAIVAHNARFDMTALNSTLRYQTKSRRRFFLPYGVKVLDSMKIAKQVLQNDEQYKNFCLKNGYMTNQKTPRPRYSAEVLWRYFGGDNTFNEAHTGLADVEIESQIFVKCLEALRHKASKRLAGAYNYCRRAA